MQPDAVSTTADVQSPPTITAPRLLPAISMLINTGPANKLQKSCIRRSRQPTAAPQLTSQGPATRVSLLGRLARTKVKQSRTLALEESVYTGSQGGPAGPPPGAQTAGCKQAIRWLNTLGTAMLILPGTTPRGLLKVTPAWCQETLATGDYKRPRLL